jgi:hypothetical protein
MQYRLRTLLIALAIGPPVLAALWLFAPDISFVAVEFVFPVLATVLGIFAIAGIAALALVAIYTPGIIVFYMLSAVLLLFRRTE